MKANFEDLSEQSKLWIYSADRFLNDEESLIIENELSTFLNEWNAHGSPILNFGKLYHKRFLVIFADETKSYASGCSIDKSVHFIEYIGQKLGIDWFNRLQFQYIKDDKVIAINGASDLKDLIKNQEISGDTLIFDNTIKDKGQFEKEWTKPLKESWLKRYLK